MVKKLPKSIRKHIRLEKARIRREVLDMKKQEELINQLYQKVCQEAPKNKKQADVKRTAAPKELAKDNENKRNL